MTRIRPYLAVSQHGDAVRHGLIDNLSQIGASGHHLPGGRQYGFAKARAANESFHVWSRWKTQMVQLLDAMLVLLFSLLAGLSAVVFCLSWQGPNALHQAHRSRGTELESSLAKLESLALTWLRWAGVALPQAVPLRAAPPGAPDRRSNRFAAFSSETPFPDHSSLDSLPPR